jgi:bifunctional non-homologous end joining protein LigD
VSADREVTIDGRALRLTSTDRVLWPQSGFTKGDLIEYYLAVAEALLARIADRPVTLGRWPQGVEGRGFAQTECRGRPDWLETRALRLRTGEVRRYCLVRDRPSLAWVANLAAIELHAYPWSWEYPDRPIEAVLDLDPGDDASAADLARAALLTHGWLSDRGLRGIPKATGASGMHVHVPLGGPCPPGEATELARALAGDLAAGHPSLIAPRRGAAARVLIDWRQSAPRSSTVAPYSLRATDVPYAAAPLSWGEVERVAEDGSGEALRFGPEEMIQRVRSGDDPLAP